MQRRNFLKAAGVTGAGLVATTGTVAAASMNITHIDEVNIGDGFADRGARFRMLRPEDRGEAGAQASFDKARGILRDAYNKSSYLDGVYIQMYTFDAGFFGRYDDSLARELDKLDDAAADAGFTGNDYGLVWDCGDGQYHSDDWPSAHPTVPYTDPAYASSNWHPTYTDGTTGDGHHNDYPHLRVATPDPEPGRMGHAMVVSLTRTRDAWPWESADDPPCLYNIDHEWELGAVVDNGYYDATGHGSSLNDERLEITAQGSCSGDDLGSSYSAGSEYVEEVTYCTSDTISDAIEWFHY